jgi:hypothetical protein
MTEVCFVLAPGQNHFFVEVAEAMKVELDGVGVRSEISRDGFPPLRDGLVYVLIPPHEFRGLAPPEHWPTPAQLERTLLYCFEQPGTKFFEEDVRMSRGPVGAVLDINAGSVEAFRQEGVLAHHAPLGWTSAWTCPEPRERDVDLLHLGIYSPRRGQALAQSADRLARWRSALILGDDHGPNSVEQPNFTIGHDKWDLLARSRVLLNIHVGERPYFEWLRVIQAICNGVLVVSEHSKGTAPLRAGEHFVSGAADELVALAEPYLEDEDLRAETAGRALDYLRQRLPLSATARRVSLIAEDVGRRPVTPGYDDEVVDWPDNSGIRAQLARGAPDPVAGDHDLPFRPGDDEVALIEDSQLRFFPGGLSRLEIALARDPTAAFAWGMVVEDDGGTPALRNVFPWQPWRLAGAGYIERPVLWRAEALRAVGVPAATLNGDSANALYRRAAARGMYGVHVPEIVARRVQLSEERHA